MKIIPLKHLWIWTLLALSIGAQRHLAAQKMPFPETLEIEGVNAWDAFANNISKYDGSYLFINDGDTINLTIWASRANILKKAADYFSLNTPIVKTDTLEFNSSTDSLALIEWGYFHIDIMNPENSAIILNHYTTNIDLRKFVAKHSDSLKNGLLSADKTELIRQAQLKIVADDKEVWAKFGDLNRHKMITFRHEYKHYQNEILIISNIQNLVPEEIFLLCVLNEVTARMTIDVTALSMATDQDAYVRELVKEYVNDIIDNPGERRKFVNNVRSYLRRYVGPESPDANQTVFYFVACEMFSFEDKLVSVGNNGIAEYAFNLIKESMPSYEKIIKDLNSRVPSSDQVTAAYGRGNFDEQMENWIQMAKERKDIE